ncbi:GNAT family N-acetyltransferase [Mucilaginibacter sp.]|uniref:GNAT family N-acetyltransferase n=1 Tax=Mucilaginibacter sp. TaxID=1882438 RepID=UPI0035BC2A4D
MNIYIVIKAEYPHLIDLWENSVRATHHYLTEDDIAVYKQLLQYKYLSQVKLYCTRQNGQMTGFVGIAGDLVHMLFIHPHAMGKGAGKRLLEFAIDQKQVKKVNVNEQNEQAKGFYRYMGFDVTGRSETDGAGKPYPILQMELI